MSQPTAIYTSSKIALITVTHSTYLLRPNYCGVGSSKGVKFKFPKVSNIPIKL